MPSGRTAARSIGPVEVPEKIAAHRQPPDVVGVVDVGDDHLERRLADRGRRDVLEDRVQERAQVARSRVRIA